MDLKINLRVITNSKINLVDQFLCDDGEYRMVVRTSHIPEKGKANDKVTELIADFFAVNKSSVYIMLGAKNRNKIVLVQKIKEMPNFEAK
jgi:uncharacterized protein YggU (UPF0235/DUF167 family)